MQLDGGYSSGGLWCNHFDKRGFRKQAIDPRDEELLEEMAVRGLAQNDMHKVEINHK